MQKEIQSDQAPAPIGPYSQAIAFNNMIFTSGQIAIDPLSGQLFEGEIEAEAALVLDNLKAVLGAGGSNLKQVLKCTIFIKDMSLFSRINEVYAQYFSVDPAPARETVEVCELPKGANIEISAIAYTS